MTKGPIRDQGMRNKDQGPIRDQGLRNRDQGEAKQGNEVSNYQKTKGKQIEYREREETY